MSDAVDTQHTRPPVCLHPSGCDGDPQHGSVFCETHDDLPTYDPQLADAVERFPAGTRVFYWPINRQVGPKRVGTTLEAPFRWRARNNDIVVRLEKEQGGTDVLLLTHVEHWADEPGRVIPPMRLDELEQICAASRAGSAAEQSRGAQA